MYAQSKPQARLESDILSLEFHKLSLITKRYLHSIAPLLSLRTDFAPTPTFVVTKLPCPHTCLLQQFPRTNSQRLQSATIYTLKNRITNHKMRDELQKYVSTLERIHNYTGQVPHADFSVFHDPFISLNLEHHDLCRES